MTLTNKLRILVIASMCGLVFITVLIVRMLSEVQVLSEKTISTHVEKLVDGSELARKLSTAFSSIELLQISFVGDQRLLQRESGIIRADLDDIMISSADENRQKILTVFIRNYMEYILHASELNATLAKQNGRGILIAHQLNALDTNVTEKIINNSRNALKKAHFQQLSALIAEFNESFILINKDLSELKLYLNRPHHSRVDSIVDDMIDRVDALHLGLKSTKTSDRDIVSFSEKIRSVLIEYRNNIWEIKGATDNLWSASDNLVEIKKTLLILVEQAEKSSERNSSTLSLKLNEIIDTTKNTLFLVALGLVSVTVLSMVMIVRRNIQLPMQSILQGIKDFKEGDLNKLINLNRSDEWHDIEEALNEMATKIHQSYSDLENKQETLDHLAHHDVLTGLPNRLLFMDRLQQSIDYSKRHEQKIALLFIDLDQFKNINDSLGHAVGDQLLKSVAQRISQTIRNSDSAARLGGDEFTVLLQNVTSPLNVSEIANKLLERLNQPIDVEGHELYATISIGVCLYPDNGDDAATLLKHADAAMYKAKQEGRNTYRFYTADMTEKAYELMLMEAGIRRALAHNEFTVLYQPQFDLKTGEMVGAEALVRWLHPDLGLLAPDKFIQVAEDSGLIVEIDHWVWRIVCEQVVTWKRQGFAIDHRTFSINCSGRQFAQPDLPEVLERILIETNCKPEWIELEITEQYIMSNPKMSSKVMRKLCDMGFSIAIDDFGTGYSSLSYLKYLPVETIKIDRSFVQDILEDDYDAAIVRTVIHLAHNLNMHVVAEGVETEEHRHLLENEGCDFAQGYLYDKPITTDVLEKYLLQQYRSESR